MTTLALLGFFFVGCDKDDVPTTTDYTFSVWAGEAGFEGYDDDLFADGYEVGFNHWISVFKGVGIGDHSTGDTVYVVDWTQTEDGPIELATFPLSAGTHDVSFETTPAVSGATFLTEVDEELYAEMVREGASHYVDGWGEKSSKVYI